MCFLRVCDFFTNLEAYSMKVIQLTIKSLLLPFVLFQNPEGKGMLDRFTSFFQRKKSGKRHQSATSTSSPSSPVSPRFPSSPYEDGQTTPTDSHENGELAAPRDADSRAEMGETLSRSSSPSASSVASRKTDDLDLPFADSNSSGRSSVREVHVCRVSTAGGEKNSGKAASAAAAELEPAAHPDAGSYSDLDLTKSVVEEVSKRLQVNLDENMPSCGEENIVTPTTPLSVNFSLSKTAETPKSPNLTSISLASKKMEVKVGDKGHSTVLKGITLGSRFSASHSVTAQQETNPPEVERRGSGFRVSTGSVSENVAATTGTWSRSPERQQTPRAESPVQVHKAIWVETYLGEDHEGEGERLKQEEEGIRADSPPLLAIPVTVIPEDDSLQEESPCALSGSLLTGGSVPALAATPEEFQAISPPPEEPSTGTVSPPGSLQERRTLGETRVARNTVNLPPKDKVLAQRAFINPELSLEGGEGSIAESTSESSKPAQLKP